VIGVPDPKYGEELCACIIVKEGERLDCEEVRRFCQGCIAHFKVPRYVRFVDGFPTTVTGKVMKFALRESMAAELGLLEEVVA
jgi:fatty-acyl-CoA synthase